MSYFIFRYLFVFLNLIILISCERAEEEKSIGLDKKSVIFFNRGIIGKDSRIFINNANQEVFLLDGTCLLEGMELSYALEGEEGTVFESQTGKARCHQGTWGIGPFNLLNLSESDEVKVTVSALGTTIIVYLEKNAISPTLAREWQMPEANRYEEGGILDFIVTYDKQVVSTGSAPYLNLHFTNRYNKGRVTSGRAFLHSDHDDNPNTQLFHYAVEEGVFDLNGMSISSNIIVPENSTWGDLAGNPAPLEVSNTGILDNVLIHSIEDPPRVTRLRARGSGIYSLGDTIDIEATFNRDVMAHHLHGLSLSFPGGGTAWAMWVPQNTYSRTQVFRFTVEDQLNISTATGASIESDGSVGFIVDRQNNPVDIQSIDQVVENFFIDSTPPRTAWVGEHDPQGTRKQFTWNWNCLDVNPCTYRTAFNTSPTHTFQEGPFESAASFTTTSNILGTYYLHVQAQDGLGNTSSVATGSVDLDAQAPRIISASGPSGGVYPKESFLSFILRFNEDVLVDTTSGIPSLTLTIGSHTRQAVYTGGSGSRELIFSYQIQEIDTSVKGISVADIMALNDGIIEDRSDNAMKNFSLGGMLTGLGDIDVDVGTLTRVEIVSAPPYINIQNKESYNFQGTCSEDLGPSAVEL